MIKGQEADSQGAVPPTPHSVKDHWKLGRERGQRQQGIGKPETGFLAFNQIYSLGGAIALL